MHSSPIFILLVQVSVILAAARTFGLLCRYIGQPQVVGEMVAGIVLGPSLLGAIAPGLSASLFPPASVGLLNVLSQFGVVFFLFLIGLELDPKLLRNRGHTAVAISHMSILAPFLLGAALTLFLYPRLFNDAPHMSFPAVSLFMGAAMSVTAFPVLARILTERNLHKTRLGATAITCAAVDDVTAWCILAVVIGVARSAGVQPGLVTAGLAAVYVLAMFFAVRPLLRRMQVVYDMQGRLGPTLTAAVFLLILVSAAITEAIGIHALFGAFLMGVIMPKGTRFVRALGQKLEDFTVLFLLPIFFAFTGLKTQIGLIESGDLWLYTGLIILTACVGKFGGSAVAGIACGLPMRESAAIGILMNTRGLMELVILNIGLTEGVITPLVFAMMVIMALTTTALTTPVLSLIIPAKRFNEGPAEEATKAFDIIAPVAAPESGPALARMASMLIGVDAADSKLFALHLQRPSDNPALRADLGEEEEEVSASLVPIIKAAGELRLNLEPITFIAADVPAGIADAARAKKADLVLMGFHKAVFGRTILGGTVRRVLQQCDRNVAILVDRGLDKVGSILVPFMGSPHDRFALDLAYRIAQARPAAIEVLHIRPPGAISPDSPTVRTFADPKLKSSMSIRLAYSHSPLDLVLEESAKFDLLIVGLTEEFGLEPHRWAFRSERLATEAKRSMLIVRPATA